ncbi:MAG: hypothetical protein QW303_06180 [Nitrososphaerota archaeon]
MTDSPFQLIGTDACLILSQHLEGQNMFNALLTCKWLHNLIINSKHYQELHEAWKQRREMFQKCMDYIKNQHKLCVKCKKQKVLAIWCRHDYEFLGMNIVKGKDYISGEDKIFKAFRLLIITGYGKATQHHLGNIGKLYINEAQIHETVPIGEFYSKYRCMKHLKNYENDDYNPNDKWYNHSVTYHEMDPYKVYHGSCRPLKDM